MRNNYNLSLYGKLFTQLQELQKSGDTKDAHYKADEILKKIALNTTLPSSARQQLVKEYDKVNKWFA